MHFDEVKKSGPFLPEIVVVHAARIERRTPHRYRTAAKRYKAVSQEPHIPDYVRRAPWGVDGLTWEFGSRIAATAQLLPDNLRWGVRTAEVACPKDRYSGTGKQGAVMVRFRIVVLASSVLLPALVSAQPMPAPDTAMSVQTGPAPRDWTTWGYDQERTGWNKGETTLTKNNVSRLKLLWNSQLSTAPRDVVLSTLTAPLIVEGVQTAQGAMDLVVLLGADDTVFAVNADTGKVVWQKSFPNAIAQVHPANWECANTANATPVIDKQRAIVFAITSDGKLRGLNLSDGAERMPATDMVVPFARDWSLNLIDNVVYTTNGRGCGQFPGQLPLAAPPQGGGAPAEGGGARRPVGPVVWGNISAMDVSDLAHPRVTHFYTSGARPAGPWGRGGVARGPGSTVITQTADGPFDPGGGVWGETVLKLAPQATRVVDSFTPANWKYLNAHDLDFGSASPEVFSFQNRTFVATSGKEGVVYLLDANNLGGGPPDHATPVYKSPQLGNDAALGTEPGEGVWSGITTYETPGRKTISLRSDVGPAIQECAGLQIQ